MARVKREERPPLVAIAAGGTGGHVFPAIALAGRLTAEGFRVALVTDRRGDSVRASFAGTVYRVRAGAVVGMGGMAKVRNGVALAVGTAQSFTLLARLMPRVVVGLGGYASLPTMIAALALGRRTMIHEQNAVLGRANRLIAARVDRIATAFTQVRGIPMAAAASAVRCGMPIRTAFAGVVGTAFSEPGDDGTLRLLVLGGSQGAHVFSAVVPAALRFLPDRLRDRLRVSQQCRPEDLDAVRTAYSDAGIEAELATFFDDVPARLAAAHLVVARAGASTIAELTAVGRPAVLVPYPYAADDHQAANAAAVEAAGAGWMIPQGGFTGEALADRLRHLFGEPEHLSRAARQAAAFGIPDAAARLAAIVADLAEGPVEQHLAVGGTAI